MKTLGDSWWRETSDGPGFVARTIGDIQFKIRDFQIVLDELDYQHALLLDTIAYLQDVDFDVAYPLILSFEELDAKKSQFVAAAEALNFAADGAGFLGVDLPSIQIPAGLAGVPLVIPAAVLASLTAAAVLIDWAHQWMSGVNERLTLAQQHVQTLETVAKISDPQARDAATQRVVDANLKVTQTAAEARASQVRAEKSNLSQIAEIAKWGAVAGLGMMVLQYFTKKGG